MPKRKATTDNYADEDSQPSLSQKRLRKSLEPDQIIQLQITDLPIDCLSKIFANINFWHHNRIRATCRCFQQVHDIFLRHEFQKALHQYSMKQPDSLKTAILHSIKRSTEIYVDKGGFDMIFLSSLLTILRRNYQTPFEFETRDLKLFLTSFFTTLEKQTKNPDSHQSIMLYALTMLNLLKSFHNYEFNITEKDRKLILYYLIPNIWLGTLFRRNEPKREKCNGILAVLGLLLVGSRSHSAIKYVYELQQEVFLCGTDVVGRRSAQSEFEITIEGSKKIRDIFKSWLHCKDYNEFNLPVRLYSERFEFTVKTTCKSAVNWGCPSTKILSITPKK